MVTLYEWASEQPGTSIQEIANCLSYMVQAGKERFGLWRYTSESYHLLRR